LNTNGRDESEREDDLAMVGKMNVFGQFMKGVSNIPTLCLVGLMFLAIAPVQAFGSAANCPDGIAAYWNLDETAAGTYADAVGTNDGTCSTCPSSTTGTVDGAQLFGGSQSISVNANSVFNWSAGQSFSIELWMRRGPSVSSLETFIGRTDGAALSWYIGINTSGRAQASLKDANGNGPGVLTGSKNLTNANAVWHHVALVRSGTTNRLYVDGEIAASQTWSYTAGFSHASAPVTLGSLNGGNRFGGGLDEVAVYNRALSANEIKSHYYVTRGYCDLYDAPVHLMAMGDSITRGLWNASLPADNMKISYRYDLWSLLNNNLYWFDYLGSQQNGQAVDASFDPDNAGFPGISDVDLITLLTTGYDDFANQQIVNGRYLSFYPTTEIILLHIGTNATQTTAADVNTALNEIDTTSRNITVVLAKIIDESSDTGGDPNVPAYNDALDVMADTRIASGDKIIVVDMENISGFNYAIDTTSPHTSGDMYDQYHPNPSGYNKMAAQWFATLETVLPVSDVPAFTSTAPTGAVVNQLYSYTAAANGPPAPTYTLVTRPTGMTINASSGLIQWTPTTTGNQSVTVRATNWAGHDDQSFTISVTATAVLQAVDDAYGGIAEGGALNVPAATGVMNNDTRTGSTTAVLVTDVSHGTLTLYSDGSFDYTHDGSQNFNDSFTYKLVDGAAESAPATVTLTITPPTNPPGDDSSGGGGGGGGCFIGSMS
jgi:VCBS repeat-containing protein